MLNKVLLIGRLTKDPELRTASNNENFLAFTLAVSSDFKSDITNFIGCFAWRKRAETMAKYLHKGSLISIEGYLATRRDPNTNNTTMNVQVINFHFLENKNKTSSNINSSNLNDQFKPSNTPNNSTDLEDNSESISFDEEETIVWE